MKVPAKRDYRQRMMSDIKALPYYSKLPRDYKWPYLRAKKEVDKKARLEDFGLEVRFWQIGLLQLGSLVLLFMLMKFFVESIFSNPAAGRHKIISTLVDAILLDFTRHTLLANLPYILLIFIGIGLLLRLAFVFWRFMYVSAQEKNWPTGIFIVLSIFYFIIVYGVAPIFGAIKAGQYFWGQDLRYFVVYLLSMFLIGPPTVLGTLTLLCRKQKAAYILMAITLSIIVLYSLLVFAIISEDIQQAITLPSFSRMTTAVLFGVLFGSYLLVTRLYIVYKHRIHFSVDKFEERHKKSKLLQEAYLTGLNRSLAKMLMKFLGAIGVSFVLSLIPVLGLYYLNRNGPEWFSQAYEFNSVYGLMLPFIVLVMLLFIVGGVLNFFLGRKPAQAPTSKK